MCVVTSGADPGFRIREGGEPRHFFGVSKKVQQNGKNHQHPPTP